MTGKFNIVPITSEDSSFNNKDGKLVKAFKITVMQGEEVLNMPCSEIAYNDAKKLQFKSVNADIDISEGQKDGKTYKTYRLLGFTN